MLNIKKPLFSGYNFLSEHGRTSIHNNSLSQMFLKTTATTTTTTTTNKKQKQTNKQQQKSAWNPKSSTLELRRVCTGDF